MSSFSQKLDNRKTKAEENWIEAQAYYAESHLDQILADIRNHYGASSDGRSRLSDGSLEIGVHFQIGKPGNRKFFYLKTIVNGLGDIRIQTYYAYDDWSISPLLSNVRVIKCDWKKDPETLENAILQCLKDA